MKKFVFLALLLSLTACAKPIPTLTRFDVELAKKMMQPGSNTVEGSALIRQRGGGIVTCAGYDVALIPATAYAEERMYNAFKGTHQGYTPPYSYRLDTPDPNYLKYQYTGMCDTLGKFKFKNVGDGEYFIFTRVTWEVPGPFGPEIQGGYLMRRVKVKDGEVLEIVLSS